MGTEAQLANGHKDSFSTPSQLPWQLKKPVPEDLDNFLKNPGAPRAVIAASKEAPDGSIQSNRNRTVLQQHVDYWDFDNDGKIYPLDTYRGFYNIGFPPILAFLSVFVIHSAFSWWSQDSWLPDPFFSILTKNIHRTRHGSDSQIYDSEGRFVPQKFEELFTKYDKTGKGGLSLWELLEMTAAVRKIMDPFGWSAAQFEWLSTYYVCHNKDGYIEKEKIRRVYDGTLFPELEREYKIKRGKKLN